MNEQLNKILDLFKLSDKKEICIIGKGGSLDQIDINNLDKFFVININDSENIHVGDVGVFYHDWVLEYFTHKGANCDLYLTDKTMGTLAPHIVIDRVSADPENILPTQERFFDHNVQMEDSVLITALKLSNWMADKLRQRLNVYLLGFDFTLSTGFSRHLDNVNLHEEQDFVENLLSTQEAYLKFILNHGDDLSIDVQHVGNKSYSKLLPEQFSAGDRDVNNSNITTDTGPIFHIDNKNHTYNVKVIAEITTNHFGDLQLLKKMIIAAKVAGADFIKLQKRDVETFYTEEELNKDYISPFGKTFREYRNGLELDEFSFKMVDKWCKEYGIDWFVSVLDEPSYEYMKQFSPKMIKLPSTISEHKEFLDKVAKDFKNDIVLSTGMTDKHYEDFVLNTFTNCDNLYLLQCVSSYPTKNENANVAVVRHYHDLSKQHSHIQPGYSSHDIGSICCMLAVAAGAKMIEKHVKYGNTPWAHFDNVAIDMLTENFKSFVEDIRRAEVYMGSGDKEVQKSEHHKYFKRKVSL